MPEIQEYKGNKLICLNPGSRFPFSFGLAKAKMILDNIESIKKFIETNGESCDFPPGDTGSMNKADEPF